MHPHLGILAFCFFGHWNFDLILSNIRILAVFLQTLEFLCNPATANIEILALSFHILELWSYSPFILPNTGIIALYLYTLVFWSNPSKHWDLGPNCLNIGILALFLKILEFLSYPFTANIATLPYFYKHWNSQLILPKILFFQPLEFWPCS